jgi:hypothetical protein
MSRWFAALPANSSSSRRQFDRSGTAVFGSDAKNNTIQTQRRTTSLYKNSPVRFQTIGSADTLHLTTPGVEKKNDHVIANVPIPINEPSADRSGINAPAARIAAVVNSIMPSR